MEKPGSQQGESHWTSRGKGPKLDQATSYFIALTIVVILVVILSCADRATMFLIVGLLVGIGLAYSTTVGAGGKHEHKSESRDGSMEHQRPREGFFPVPGAPAPYPVSALYPAAPAPAYPNRYPGAIDTDEYETEADYGHRDRTEGDSQALPQGNPFNPGRVAFPPAAGPEVDDEANDAEIDADELNTYQGRSRNDSTRVTAGTMNRRKDLDKYFREELDEAYDREWWGRAEE